MNSEHNNTFERYKLVAFGEHPHRKGRQRFDRAAAQALVEDFYSLKGRLARRFGGLPVYVGHPDDAEFTGRAGHDDTRAHGWVHGLEVCDDGLYMRVKWARSGRDLLTEAHYKYLSPRWLMEPVEADVYRPVRLLSVGLTNTPNILGEPVANAAPAEDPGEVAGVGQSLELAATTLAAVAERLEVPAEDADGLLEALEQRLESVAANDTAPTDTDRWFRLAEDAHTAREQAERRVRELETALAQQQTTHVDTLLDHALREGRLQPAEAASWREALEADPAAANAQLMGRDRVLKTTARTAGLGQRTSTQSPSRQLLEAVNSRMAETGEDFQTAWSALRPA
ncbi:MAG: hypothetical protein E1N59_2279 [Puniceicoccaceae bacterium 5H]|nr:MAG: hypothetical protein E1N59_2279 [Puniceicoccaceae bacterium 5H]